MDGHNSHYTYKFLNYARMHKILVFCYPSHTTHILQGLNVVLFATVKRCLGDERDTWEFKMGEQVNKTNFLGIYGRAHLCALTPDNVRAAFRKTGVWPFNPGVVLKEMLAPSKETSCEAHLPVAPSTPVRIIAKMLRKLAISTVQEVQEEGSDDEDGTEDDGAVVVEDDDGGVVEKEGSDESDTEDENEKGQKGNRAWGSDDATTIRNTISKLADGSLAPLVSTDPMTSSSRLEHNTMAPIPPAHFDEALNVKPRTSNERLLLSVLREALAHEEALRLRVINLQASSILNEGYWERLRGQLAFQKDKKAGRKKKGKLMGDGLPVLLTRDVFFEKVVEAEASWRKEKREKKQRQTLR